MLSLKRIFSSKWVTVALVLFVVSATASIYFLTRGATPDPGHPWTQVGNGLFQISNDQTQLRTFLFPDTDAEILTGSSSITLPQRTLSASTSLSISTNTIIFVDASTSPITVTLPSASGTNSGLTFAIKKIDSALANLVTINPLGSQTIDGLTSISLANRGESALLQSDGTIWRSLLRRNYDFNSYHVKGTTRNMWYSSPSVGTALSTGSPTPNRLYAMPLLLTKVSTIDKMAISVSTATSTENAEVGIYNDSGNAYPTSLIVDVGSISFSVTGSRSSTTNLPITLDAGLYWLVINLSNNSGVMRTFAASGLIPVLGYASTFSTNAQFGWSSSSTFGALPSTFPLLPSSTPITAVPLPAIYVRFSG